MPDTLLAPYLNIDVIRKYLPRKLPGLTGDILHELSDAVDSRWGTDTEEWHEVPLFETCQNLMARISNRLLVGLPLCRNEDLLSRFGSIAASIYLTGAVIRAFPSWLRPFVGPLAAMPIQNSQRKIYNHLGPIVAQRLADFERSQHDPEFAKAHPQPNDYLQWEVEYTATLNRPELRTIRCFCTRIIMMNIIMLHTTVHTIINALLDIVSHPDAEGILATLREEAHAAIVEPETPWTRDTISNHLPKLDSAMRESMRLHPVTPRGITRRVSAKDGITLPNSVAQLPWNQEISINMHGLQRDPDNYKNGHLYDPFRFSRANEKLVETTEESSAQPLVMVSPTPTYLSFGFGRNACPGRFLAAQEVKIFMVYVLLNYEIRPLKQGRPSNKWFGDIVVPPTEAKISLRRRKLSEDERMPRPGNVTQGTARIA